MNKVVGVMVQSDLFEPSSSLQIVEAVDGVVNSAVFEVAGIICVLAVALFGFSMLAGRFSFRRGFSVVAGCFVLLGAPVLAGSLFAFTNQNEAYVTDNSIPVTSRLEAREELPPAENDPYAGASLRFD